MTGSDTASGASINLSVVVPAFNEDQNLAIVIDRAVVEIGASGCGPYELVIVDDGSADKTGEVADRLATRYSQVRVVHHDRNRGFGAAIQSGYRVARGRYVTQIPADGEIDVSDALGLLNAIGDYDVIASRRERPDRAGRNGLTLLFHLLLRLIVGFDGSGLDGIFVIRRDVLNELPLGCNTGLINLETLMRCARRGCRMTVGVVRAVPRLSGTSKVTNLATMVKTLGEIVKLRLRMGRGVEPVR